MKETIQHFLSHKVQNVFSTHTCTTLITLSQTQSTYFLNKSVCLKGPGHDFG